MWLQISERTPVPFFDLPLADLETYRPDVREPADFDDFWASTLKGRMADVAERLEVTPAAFSTPSVEFFEVTFPGYGAQEIHALYSRPAVTSERLPIIVEFVGYGGGRGLPVEHLAWASSGYAHLVVDTRGQGTHWGGGGDTGDTADAGAGGNGFMTRGITSPETYYYRRVFVDAVKSLAAARLLPGVNGDAVVTTGGSQGGAITLAATALDGNTVGLMPNVPFLCNFERAIGLTGVLPYEEIVQYLAVKRDHIDLVFDTLSYFDCVNFAKRISVPALFSVGLMDTTTPPSTVFAAYNHLDAPKRIEVYPYNGHEGGGPYQLQRQIAWADELLRRS